MKKAIGVVCLFASSIATSCWASPSLAADGSEGFTRVSGPGGSTVTYREGATLPTEEATSPGTAAARAVIQDPCGSSAAITRAVGDFRLSFGSGFSTAEQDAVAFAARRWSDTIVARRPIEVRVEFDTGNFEPGILGGASPCGFFAPDANAPAYAIAHANTLANADLNGGTPEIGVVLSATEDFYLGTGSSVPANQISLATLAMHELGHGIGITTLARRTGSGSITVNFDDGTPYIYDTFVRSNSRNVTRLSTSALQSALVNPLAWAGREGRRASGGSLSLYAPNPFETGSSVSHVARSGQMMSPFIAKGKAILTVPGSTRGILTDIGWVMEDKLGDQAFVAALGRDFLGRTSSHDELVGYTGALASGQLTHGQLIVAYATSEEWVGYIVDGLYRSTLGREPDSAGKAYWIRTILAGQTPAQVAAYFYAGDEFFQRSGGTNRAWVRALYREILRREPDTSGWNFWTDLAASGVTRSDIAYEFYQSIESRRRRVTDLYGRLLQRRPDQPGREYWAGVLTNGRDIDLAIFLAESPEYFVRAGQRF